LQLDFLKRTRKRMSDTKHIDTFIDNNATSTIIKRGKQIYKANEWSLDSIDLDNKKMTFRMDSSSRDEDYQVEITNYNIETLDSSCTCPYDWGPMCKHEVAALMVVKQELGNGTLSSNKEEQISNVAVATVEQKKVELQNFTTIPLKNISGLLTLSNTNSRFVSRGETFVKFGYVSKLLVEDLQTIVHVTDGVKQFNVNFKRTQDESLLTTCTCQKTEYNLCEHKVAALLYIRQLKGEHFFEYLRDYSDDKAKLLEDYGYKLTDEWEDKFQFYFHEGDVKIKVKDPTILQISKPSYWNKLAASIAQPTKPIPLLSSKQQSATQDLTLGFGIVFTKSDTDVPGFEIKHLVGKTNIDGNQFKSNLAFLEDWDVSEQYVFFDKEVQAINEKLRWLNIQKIAERLNKSAMQFYFTRTNEPDFIQVQQHILALLNDLQPLIVNYITGIVIPGNGKDISNFTELNWSKESIEPKFTFVEEDVFFNLSLQLFYQDQEIAFADVQKIGFLFYKYHDELLLVDSVHTAILLEAFKKQSNIRIHQSQFFDFYNALLQPLMRQHAVDIQVNFTTEKVSRAAKKVLYITEAEDMLIFTPKIQYGTHEVIPNGQETILEKKEDVDNVILEIERDYEVEKEYLDLLCGLHPVFSKESNVGVYPISTYDVLKKSWFFIAFEKLREADIEIFGFEDLQQFKYNTNRPDFSIISSSGIDWFDVKIKVSFGEQIVDLKVIKRAILRNENYVRLGDGTLGLLPEEWLKQNETLFKIADVKGDKLQVSKLHFSLIDALYEGTDEENTLSNEIFEKKQKLLSFDKMGNYEVPIEVQADLRDYQESGFNWMCFLHEFGWGGCLADDMGLGKTLQILTFLQHIKNQSNTQRPNLVILPTSLIFNWQNEIEKFCPDLTYIIHRGSDRNRNPEVFNDYDLILTTYGILVRDIELLTDYMFNYIILDESQAIKNPNSKRYKAVRLLKSYNRIALTGTPVENNTFDLFAQMNFLNPGLLGSLQFFKEEFSKPIDRGGDKEKVTQLKKMVFPFLLRRTKKQVASELPEKTESIIYCEMGTKQRKVYEAYKDLYREKILSKMDNEGLNKSRFFILEGLMKLRQICDAPELVGNIQGISNAPSVKIDLLTEHVQEKTGNHKILIFSQFVKMLKLIRGNLDNLGVDYEYLDGSTAPNARAQGVERFQNDDNCRVFLISLKAGGFGLNLTAADYVYLVDPWWNPAVEMQAIDRTHRIGQHKNVFAYKLICKDSIEEKVVVLQNKKKKLVTDLISAEGSFYKSLDRNDIEALFS